MRLALPVSLQRRSRWERLALCTQTNKTLGLDAMAGNTFRGFSAGGSGRAGEAEFLEQAPDVFFDVVADWAHGF